MEIWPSAYRHGISEADIRHAIRNPLKTLITSDDMPLIIGAATNGRPLEIGIGRSGAIVHAMKARPKYWP